MKQVLLFTLLLSLVICAIKINIKNEQKQLIKQTLNLFDKKYPNLRTLNDNLRADGGNKSESKSGLLSESLPIIAGISFVILLFIILGRILS